MMLDPRGGMPSFLSSTRFVILMLATTCNAICYADRTNISVAILAMADEMGWDEVTVGHVLSAFFYGYLCTQILGGMLAEKHGAMPVLNVAVFTWSFFTLITPVATRISFPFLIFTRIGMGLGEGMCLPAIHALLSQWVPMSERTRSVAFVSSGQMLGTVAALACSPLVERDWPVIFYFFGVLGFMWVMAAVWKGASFPETHQSILSVERTYILRERERDQRPSFGMTEHHALPPWYEVLQHKAYAAIVIGHILHNYGWYVLLSWMPKYLSELGLSTSHAGLLAMVPYFAMFIVGNTWSWWVDAKINDGMKIETARKLSQTLAFLGPATALGIIIVTQTTSYVVAAFMLSTAIGFAACIHSGLWANIIDIAPRHAGHLLGISNTFASVPGIVGQVITGYILNHTHSWSLVFGQAVILYLVGFVTYYAWAKGTVQFP